jgi:hypothetical protein
LMILAGFYKFITINRHSLTIMNHYNIYIYSFSHDEPLLLTMIGITIIHH